MSNLIAIDIETTGLDWVRCGVIGIGVYSKDTHLIGFSKEVPDLTGYDTVFHNGSYDVKVLRKHGIVVPYIHDTLLMASLLQYQSSVRNASFNEYDEEKKLEESLRLDVLAEQYLGVKNWKIDWNKEKPSYDEIKDHCIMDCRVTYHLFEVLSEKLKLAGLWDYYNKLLMPLQRALVDVECVGIRLDINKLHDMKEDFKNRLDKWNEVFYEGNKEALDIVVNHLKEDKIAKVKDGKKPETKQNRINKILNEPLEFNPRSHVHMTKLLELRGISLVDKDGKHTTASKLLYRFKDDPIIGMIVEYKKMSKIYNDFLCKWDNIKVNDIIFTNFRLWATRTGRLSSAEPNLQQVPKGDDIRGLFIPREGKVFTVADAKQLEARLAAFYSNEPNLTKAFRANVDVYGQIAVDLMGLDCHPNEVKDKYPKERQIGKQLFLASIYGQGSNSLYYILTKEYQVSITMEECRQYKHQFNKMYHNLVNFSNDLKQEASEKGYITNWFGRKVFIPRDKDYKAINYYIQGSGSELISYSQLNIIPKLPDGARLILLVHDEVVYEHDPKDTEEILNIINKYMIQYPNERYGMFLDLEIQTGSNWGIK